MAKKLLIVDDNESIRDVCKLTLEFKGYEVIAAADGQEGLELLRAGSFDLVITDVAMPRMTGLELLDKIRGELAIRDMPVIVFTAEEFINAEEVLARGASQCFRKPFSPIDLMAAVEGLLGE